MLGRRWLVGSHGKIGRVLWGKYEPAQTALFVELLKPGDVVYDMGAHVGYYTLLSAVRVGKSGRVFCYEPDLENLRCLRSNIGLNALANVTVEDAAIGAESGVARFQVGSGSGKGFLATDGGQEVRMISMEKAVELAGVTPRLIKMDIEGAELDALEGGRAMLARCRPLLVVSLHGRLRRADNTEFADLLRSLGYRHRPIGGNRSELFCYPEEESL